MKRSFGFILTLSVVLFMAPSLYSAEVPQVQEGAKAIFWGFNGLADLSVENSVIGFQYNIADRIGLYATLGLGMVSQSVEDDDQMSSSQIDFSVGAMLYLFKSDPVAFFVAPTFGISTQSEEDLTSSTKHVDSQTDFGIGIECGAEWWFTTNVSLTAATTLGFVTSIKSTERGNDTADATTTTFGTMNGHSTHFTLSFYF